MADTEKIVIDDVDAFLDDLAKDDDIVVHPVEYTEGKKTFTFLVKEFDQEEILQIATGPLTFIDGKIVKRAKHEAEMGINLRIHYGILKNVGTEENPKYEKMFTLAQLRKLYTGKKRGRLLNFLLTVVQDFNPDTDPTKKK